jgi:hypothetical protein
MDVSMHFAYTQGCGTAIILIITKYCTIMIMGKSQTENNFLVYGTIRLVYIGILSSFSKEERRRKFSTNQTILW